MAKIADFDHAKELADGRSQLSHNTGAAGTLGWMSAEMLHCLEAALTQGGGSRLSGVVSTVVKLFVCLFIVSFSIKLFETHLTEQLN